MSSKIAISSKVANSLKNAFLPKVAISLKISISSNREQKAKVAISKIEQSKI
jgi:DNA-binding protein